LVKAEKYVQLTNSASNEKIYEPVMLDVIKGSAEPGEQIKYNIITGFDKIWMIHTTTIMDQKTSTAYDELSNNAPGNYVFQVQEEHRGGMATSYAFVQHNRVYSGNERFTIPWSNKDLNISYETFRDKLLPGSQEKWKVKITGNKGEKVASEMLVSMYDASLDQFKPHSWYKPNIWPGLYNTISWEGDGFEAVGSEEFNKTGFDYLTVPNRTYDMLWGFDDYAYARDGFTYMFNAAPPSPVMANQSKAMNEVVVAGAFGVKRSAKTGAKTEELKGDALMVKQYDSLGNEVGVVIKEQIQTPEPPKVQVRKNFNETAFFFPDLRTDAEGNIEFSFTIPEALTKWKLMTLAHTKDVASGYSEKTVITQKPLMVQPNAPRFMREGDNMEFTAKIVNMGEKEVTGIATLELLDAATNKPVDGWFKNVFPNQYFTVAPGQSQAVKFPMEIPFNFNSALTYRIKAVSKASPSGGGLEGADFSDGEEMAIPVLTNRMLVTETLPLNMRNQTTKTFKFDKLLNSGNSTTITNHALTIEYTSNPAWYAVQALPYLMDYPYECAEQTFNRYYANTLASYISR
jgi:hypothetical protein